MNNIACFLQNSFPGDCYLFWLSNMSIHWDNLNKLPEVLVDGLDGVVDNWKGKWYYADAMKGHVFEKDINEMMLKIPTFDKMDTYTYNWKMWDYLEDEPYPATKIVWVAESFHMEYIFANDELFRLVIALEYKDFYWILDCSSDHPVVVTPDLHLVDSGGYPWMERQFKSDPNFVETIGYLCVATKEIIRINSK